MNDFELAAFLLSPEAGLKKYLLSQDDKGHFLSMHAKKIDQEASFAHCRGLWFKLRLEYSLASVKSF